MKFSYSFFPVDYFQDIIKEARLFNLHTTEDKEGRLLQSQTVSHRFPTDPFTNMELQNPFPNYINKLSDLLILRIKICDRVGRVALLSLFWYLPENEFSSGTKFFVKNRKCFPFFPLNNKMGEKFMRAICKMKKRKREDFKGAKWYFNPNIALRKVSTVTRLDSRCFLESFGRMEGGWRWVSFVYNYNSLPQLNSSPFLSRDKEEKKSSNQIPPAWFMFLIFRALFFLRSSQEDRRAKRQKYFKCKKWIKNYGNVTTLDGKRFRKTF